SLNQALGHDYPHTPTFGLPCPTTIFTLALMMWLERPFPRVLLVIPLTWAAIGGSAAFFLGVPQDLGLLAAGLSPIAFSGNGRLEGDVQSANRLAGGAFRTQQRQR